MHADEQELCARINTLSQMKQSMEDSVSSLTAGNKLNPAKVKLLRQELANNEANEKEIEKKIDTIQALVNKAAVDRMKAEAKCKA